MKFFPWLAVFLIGIPLFDANAEDDVDLNTDANVDVVAIPYMEITAVHRDFADVLLKLALQLSEDKYGPFKIIQHKNPTVILRQLQELERGETLSVAVAMPVNEWLSKAHVVQFPVLKGLSSYRMFLVHKKNLQAINNIDSIEVLRTLKVGQGPGWSTARILENNGFQIVYGGPYQTLIPMLKADRFQLFMRAVYEIGPEYQEFSSEELELSIAEDIAAYTYLPMYFFVSKQHPHLVERLEYGLKKAHANGQHEQLFQQYFGDALKLMNAKKRKVFYLNNTNIDASFFEADKPYLLDSIRKLETGLSR